MKSQLLINWRALESGLLLMLFIIIEQSTFLCRELLNFVSLSFPTISSSGSNGAIIHYRPVPETAKKLSPNELYLCDSGAQFLDGTTDVTRTVSFGEPSLKEKVC